jgi:hypothetical protein
MATTTVEDNNINPTYLDATDNFTKERIVNANKAADYWYYEIGANPIPADTERKQAYVLNSWKPYPSPKINLGL